MLCKIMVNIVCVRVYLDVNVYWLREYWDYELYVIEWG